MKKLTELFDLVLGPKSTSKEKHILKELSLQKDRKTVVQKYGEKLVQSVITVYLHRLKTKLENYGIELKQMPDEKKAKHIMSILKRKTILIIYSKEDYSNIDELREKFDAFEETLANLTIFEAPKVVEIQTESMDPDEVVTTLTNNTFEIHSPLTVLVSESYKKLRDEAKRDSRGDRLAKKTPLYQNLEDFGLILGEVHLLDEYIHNL